MFCCFRSNDSDLELPEAPQRLKMVIVGDGDCGKTCLLYRFAYEEFFTRYIPTVFEVENKTVKYNGQEVDLLMYDTAGQEDYDRLRPFSYSDTDVMVICFSVDNPDSLDNVLLNWLPEVRYYCGDVPVILVGNKKDLRDPASAHGTLHNNEKDLHTDSTNDAADGGTEMETRRPEKMVKCEEGLAVAKKMGAVAYFEASAKTGDGTDPVFQEVLRVGMEVKAKKSKRLGLFRLFHKK